MASSAPHIIALQGGLVRAEETAGEAGIKPGHLLAMSSGELIKHATADGIALARLVALESPTAEAGTTPAIDTAYADGDSVYYAVGQPGDIFYMWLATANNAVRGVSALVSNGDGTLKIATVSDTTLAGAVIGVPAENLNNTSGSAARLKVQIV